MFDKDLDELEDGIRRLKVEYHIFFSGHRPKPPDDLKFRVERLIKKMSEALNMTFSERFRYTTLVTRYYVYRDLWRRTTNEHESAAETKNEEARAKTSPPPSKAPAKSISISIADPKEQGDRIQQLYDALVNIKEKSDAPISYQQFVKYISTQTNEIRGKYGCSSVVFTIALEEDSIRFKAGPEKQP